MKLKKIEEVIEEINKGNPWQAKPEARMILITLPDLMYNYLDKISLKSKAPLEDMLSMACFEQIEKIVLEMIKEMMGKERKNS